MWLLTNFRMVSTGGLSVPTWFEVAVLSHSIQMWFWKLMRAECSRLWERGSREKKQKNKTPQYFLMGKTQAACRALIMSYPWLWSRLEYRTLSSLVSVVYKWLFTLCPCQLIIFPVLVSDKITSCRAWNTLLPPHDLMSHEKHCDVSRDRAVSAIFPQHCVLYLAVRKVAWGNLSCLILWALWILSNV